jgi:hypothetical protein
VSPTPNDTDRYPPSTTAHQEGDGGNQLVKPASRIPACAALDTFTLAPASALAHKAAWLSRFGLPWWALPWPWPLVVCCGTG